MFRGYFDLRGPNDRVDRTIEQYREIEKCKVDPIYFIENYIKIYNTDYGLVNFKLRDYQKDYIKTLHHEGKILSIWARQSGNSVTNLAYIVWQLIHLNNYSIGMLDFNDTNCVENMKRIIEMMRNVPIWLQPVTDKCSTKCFRFENGNKLFKFNKEARGYELNSLVILSSSYIKDLDHSIDYLIERTNAKITMTTTGLGLKDNYLIKYWNNLDCFKVKYGYTRFIKDPGFRDMQIQNMGINHFNSEFAIEEHEQKITYITDTTQYK